MRRQEFYEGECDAMGRLPKDNPKYVQAQKDGKPRMEYLVGSVLRGDAAVHAHGADKYGERNWRVDPIKASTYEAAILRHFMAWFYDGEDADPDSGLSHLYHIRACCAVMIDAEIHGTLIDDRDRVASGLKEVEPEGEYNEGDPGHPTNVHEYMRKLRMQDD